MRFLFRFVALPLIVLILALFVAITWIAEGVGGRLHARGEVSPTPLPTSEIAARAARFRGSDSLPRESRQILFGDLHVHTTFSGDAFVFSLPLLQGEGVHPPADACDFARFCSGLDFWSINDHAESITPRQWDETREAIRECNAITNSENPDLVAFLGWEWTQSAALGAPDLREHYGHKNVILLDTEEGSVPTRPIGAGIGGLFAQPVPPAAWALLRFGISTRDFDDLQPYLDFNRFTREVRALEHCPAGIPVRDLPRDCLEGAETPAKLFEKLDDWGYPSLVIPHGTSWGIHAPPSARLSEQLSRADHNPERQRLFEVYSGQGNSVVYREGRDFTLDESGNRLCAPPQDDYLPCCWRAGDLIRERCDEDTPIDVCDSRVAGARRAVAEGAVPYGVVAGTRVSDWLECGQWSGMFMPAFDYRPNMSAQYGLALSAEDGSTFRYGLIASSDNHKARPGPGYKEMARKAFGDAYGLRRDWYDALSSSDSPLPEPREENSGLDALGIGLERGSSFYYTSGLVAVHADSRKRESIWEALENRRVYGTSGDRILLFFNLLNLDLPMGSEAELDEAPRFEVRAVGAFEQQPGCPEFVHEGLSPERLERLCLGECYHPADDRRLIERIEVVRIRKQLEPSEPVAPLIEDPWRSFDCPPSAEGCEIHFEDSEWDPRRETVYYVRALQEATPAVNGDPMRCERDSQGRCIRARPCPASGPDFEKRDDCLNAVRERAWSSPIFVRGRSDPGRRS